MNRIWFKSISVIQRGLLVGLVMFFVVGQVWAAGEPQQSGVNATVVYTEPINVRGGPSTVYYPIVGRGRTASGSA